MAFVSNAWKMVKFVPRGHLYSTSAKQVKKSVFISQSSDVFTNLALEKWLYRNFDFTNHHVLMLWQNDPCVVIGRQQNPWFEANVNENLLVARRNSNSESIYNDRGSLNLTFFTPTSHFDNHYNFHIVKRALFREYGVLSDVLLSDNIVVAENKEVLRSSAKLGRTNAYQHCNLMVQVNKVDLNEALQKKFLGIKTEVTEPPASPLINLCELNPAVKMSQLVAAVGWEYLRTHSHSLIDGGMELANQQKGFQLVNPTEQWFPGLNEIRNHLASWNWCYGQTPDFTATRSVFGQDIKFSVRVSGGHVKEVTLHVPRGKNGSSDLKVETNIIGCQFSENVLTVLEMSLSGSDKNKLVGDCVQRVVTSL